MAPQEAREARERFPFHLFWYLARPDEVDLSDPGTRAWYIAAILREGRAEDVQQLDLREVEDLLPQLRLPERVRRLWEWFLAERRRREAGTGERKPSPMLEPGEPRLTALQRRVLEQLVQAQDTTHFILSGGTALAAYYLYHRRSDDLDLFTGDLPTVTPYSYEVEELVTRAGLEVRVRLRTQSFVRMEIEYQRERLRLDLAKDAPFRFGPPKSVEIGGCHLWVENFQDLAVNKLLALFGRAEPRDFVDLYFIREHYSLEQLVAWAAQKDPGFDVYWLCVALRQGLDVSLAGLELYKPMQPEELKRWVADTTYRLCKDLLRPEPQKP